MFNVDYQLFRVLYSKVFDLRKPHYLNATGVRLYVKESPVEATLLVLQLSFRRVANVSDHSYKNYAANTAKREAQQNCCASLL